MRRVVGSLAAILLTGTVAACGSGSAADSTAASNASASTAKQTLTVYVLCGS